MISFYAPVHDTLSPGFEHWLKACVTTALRILLSFHSKELHGNVYGKSLFELDSGFSRSSGNQRKSSSTGPGRLFTALYFLVHVFERMDIITRELDASAKRNIRNWVGGGDRA